MDFKKFLKNHWLIIIILFFASLVRFWRVGDFTTFAGDQGIDFLIVKRMLVNGEFTLLGPKIGTFSDIAIIYLGPIYYYMIAPFLLLFNFDPIGPAVFISFLSVLTIIVIYLIGLVFFNKIVGIIASIIFAVSVPIVNEARVALNPNPEPFFSAVLIFALFKISIKNSKKLIWPILCGMSSGILFQLHYLTASLILLSVLLLLKNRYFQKLTVLTAAFFITISPQILFELRHGFFLSIQILTRIRSKEDISSFSTFAQNLHRSIEFISSLIFNYENYYVGLVVISLMMIFFIQKNKYIKPYIFLVTSVLISIFAASIYSLDPQLHYFTHIYVGLTLIVASILYLSMNYFKNKIAIIFFLIFVVFIIILNIANLDLNRAEGYTMPKGWNLTGVKKASEIVANDISYGTKFNIAATLDGDTRARPYRYLVEVYGKIPLGVEYYPEADILYLMSRDKKNEILNYSVWEVASFKPFKFENEWHIQNGITLYKLSKDKVTL